MAQQPTFTTGSAAPAIHNVLVNIMNPLSRQTTAEAPTGRHSGHGQPRLNIDDTASISSEDSIQIPGYNHRAAGVRILTQTPAHNCPMFMSTGISEQAHLLEGIAAMDARQGAPATVNGAGSSRPTANATVAEPSTNIKWAFGERNFHKLLKKYSDCREKLSSSRWTTKQYIEEEKQWDARIREREAYILVLESTRDTLEYERQINRDTIAHLQDMLKADAQLLQYKERQISRLRGWVQGGIDRNAERNQLA